MNANVIIPQNQIDSEIESLLTGCDDLPTLGGSEMQIGKTLCRRSREVRAASQLLSIRNAEIMRHVDDVVRRYYATFYANLMDEIPLGDL